MLKTASKQYKFVLVGDSAVGKSSLLNRFVDKNFSQSLMSTIGVDFKFKKVTIDSNDVKLQIWDTAGQQTFRSIVSAYYSSADAIIIVYDITSYQSFENIKDYWIAEAQNNNKNDARIYLIGNKIDQQSRRQVQKFSIQTFIQEHDIQGLYQASAKTGQNVQDAFIDITRSLYYGTKSKKGLNKQPNNKQQNHRSFQQNFKQEQPNSKSTSYSNNVYSKNEDQKYVEVQINSQKDQQEKMDNIYRKSQGLDRDNNSSKIKINSQKSRPKNPNYNQSCCLK